MRRLSLQHMNCVRVKEHDMRLSHYKYVTRGFQSISQPVNQLCFLAVR